MWLKPFLVPIATWADDRLGHGRINRIKKWWLDLEVVGDRTVAPKRVNRRELDIARKVDPADQKMAYYPAAVMPPPGAKEPVPLDRKAALEVRLEPAQTARLRVLGR